MCLWILHWLIRQEIINAFVGLFLKKIKSDLDVVLTCLECKCFLMQSSSKGLKVCNDVFVRNSIIWWTGCVARTIHAVFHLCLGIGWRVWSNGVVGVTCQNHWEGQPLLSRYRWLRKPVSFLKIAGQWVDSRVLIYRKWSYLGWHSLKLFKKVDVWVCLWSV